MASGLGKTLASKWLDMVSKRQMVELLSSSRLFYKSHTWNPMSPKDAKPFICAHNKAIRTALGKHNRTSSANVSDSSLATYDFPMAAQILRRKRLLYLPRVLQNAPLELRAELQTLPVSPHSWKGIILEDLEWLADFSDDLTKLGSPRAEPARWEAYMVANKSRWRRIVKQATSEVQKADAENELKVTDLSFSCIACGEAYDTPAGLRLHMTRYHDLLSLSTWYINDDCICPICLKSFHTATKLQDHLGANRVSVCLKQCVIRNIPRLSREQVDTSLIKMAWERKSNRQKGFHPKYHIAPPTRAQGPVEPMMLGPVDPRPTISYLGGRSPCCVAGEGS